MAPSKPVAAVAWRRQRAPVRLRPGAPAGAIREHLFRCRAEGKQTVARKCDRLFDSGLKGDRRRVTLFAVTLSDR